MIPYGAIAAIAMLAGLVLYIDQSAVARAEAAVFTESARSNAAVAQANYQARIVADVEKNKAQGRYRSKARALELAQQTMADAIEAGPDQQETEPCACTWDSPLPPLPSLSP